MSISRYNNSINVTLTTLFVYFEMEVNYEQLLPGVITSINMHFVILTLSVSCSFSVSLKLI